MTHNPLNTVNEEMMKEFDKKFPNFRNYFHTTKNEAMWSPSVALQIEIEIKSFLRSSNTHIAQAVIKAVKDIIRNGGTPVTVLTRQIDGQLYVNEKQLLESIATLSDNKETK